MPRRFTGIRLLLVFVAVNTVLFLMLVTSMTSEHPWLARVLPGQFGAGVNSSGYWVFFALVLLVNSLTVLAAGFVLVLPALRDGAPLDEIRLARHLIDRGGVSEDAKDSVLLALREEAISAHYQIVAGRLILLAGAIFLVLAFSGISLSFARAVPDGAMFSDSGMAVPNATVTREAVQRFTADQIAGAILLDAPEIYDWRFGALTNNIQSPLFTHFVFAFRTVLGLVSLLILIAFLRRSQAPKKPKKAAEKIAEAEAAS
jgi:hypothetical protein